MLPALALRAIEAYSAPGELDAAEAQGPRRSLAAQAQPAPTLVTALEVEVRVLPLGSSGAAIANGMRLVGWVRYWVGSDEQVERGCRCSNLTRAVGSSASVHLLSGDFGAAPSLRA
jgi:hypothetical protein